MFQKLISNLEAMECVLDKTMIYICILPILFIGCTNDIGNKNEKVGKKVALSEPDKDITTPKYPEKITCSYQNQTIELGNGVLIWKFDCDLKVEFFKDSLLSEQLGKFDFCEKVEGICPLLFKPDYGVMCFAVTDTHEKSYQVVINETEKVYLSKESPFTFNDWKTFFESDYVLGVSAKESGSFLEVESFEGDYLNVIDSEKNTKTKLRWREHNRLLIQITLMT